MLPRDCWNLFDADVLLWRLQVEDKFTFLKTVADRSACFHASMADVILQQARQARIVHGTRCVGLCGGVFQNRILTERAFSLLENDGFTVSLPETIPVNDAGISFGQVIEYAMSR